MKRLIICATMIAAVSFTSCIAPTGASEIIKKFFGGFGNDKSRVTVEQVLNVGLLNVFDNGYWERGYNFPFERGYYVLERDNIKFVTVCRLKDADPWADVWVSVSPEEEGAVQVMSYSEYFSNGYGDTSLIDEPREIVYDEYGEYESVDDYPYCHTREEFAQFGRRVAEFVQRYQH